MADILNSHVYWRQILQVHGTPADSQNQSPCHQSEIEPLFINLTAVNPSLLVILHSVSELLNVDSRNTIKGRESSEEVGVTQDSEVKSVHLFLLVLEREHFVLPSYSA
ncbi:hypothetical protein Tco_0124986 [Tanacetum coccineum]